VTDLNNLVRKGARAFFGVQPRLTARPGVPRMESALVTAPPGTEAAPPVPSTSAPSPAGETCRAWDVQGLDPGFDESRTPNDWVSTPTPAPPDQSAAAVLPAGEAPSPAEPAPAPAFPAPPSSPAMFSGTAAYERSTEQHQDRAGLPLGPPEPPPGWLWSRASVAASAAPSPPQTPAPASANPPADAASDSGSPAGIDGSAANVMAASAEPARAQFSATPADPGNVLPRYAALIPNTAPPPVPPSLAPSLPPATSPVPSELRLSAEHELLLGAFGKALQSVQDRRASDVLEVVLTAEQEHLATVMQALADQRHEYGEQLERAVRRLSDELTADSITEIGELFHRSAGEITGSLARSERYSRSLIEKQNDALAKLGAIEDGVAKLLAVATELRDIGSSLASALTNLSQQRAPPPKEPERRRSVITKQTDVLAALREDPDADDDT
jgi:hypothetical protein